MNYLCIGLEAYLNRFNQFIDTGLFESSVDWLMATEYFLLPLKAEVFVHIVLVNDEIVLALPLIHSFKRDKSKVLSSLSSFYTSTADPIYMAEKSEQQHFNFLFENISQLQNWHQIQLGPLSTQSDFIQFDFDYFSQVKVFSETKNWYQKGIISYEQYYQHLPSRLKNTIKRKTKQINANKNFQIEFVNDPINFSTLFIDYQYIYQKSWKEAEFSFDFIE